MTQKPQQTVRPSATSREDVKVTAHTGLNLQKSTPQHPETETTISQKQQPAEAPNHPEARIKNVTDNKRQANLARALRENILKRKKAQKSRGKSQA